MGINQEIEKPTLGPTGFRGRVMGLLAPGLQDQLDALTTEAYQSALKLQRVQQQNDSLMADKGVYKDNWANLWTGDYNPEQISYDEYYKMLNFDAQVIAGWELIKMGVLMKPWKIVHPDDEIRKTCEDALNRMRRPTFRSGMKEMLQAVVYGFSITETVYDEFRGFWMPRRDNGLKSLDPRHIKFFSDIYGNLLRVEQWKTGNRVELPLDRTLIWSHEREWGNYYGTSMLRGCYKNWFIKDAMLKFTNIAFERFGSPVYLGVAASIKEMGRIQNAIEHLYARSQATIVKQGPDDQSEIKILESKRTEMPFERYIKYHDEMILRRMLISQQVFEGGGGTYGAKSGMDLIFLRFQDIQLELKSVVDELLQTITDLNWFVDEYPVIEFAPLTALDKSAVEQSIYTAIEKGLVSKDESWVRQELNFPPLPKGTELPDAAEVEKEDEVVVPAHKRGPRDADTTGEK